MARNAFNIGRFGTQLVAMATKLLSLYCGEHLAEFYCNELNISDKLSERSFFIIFNQNLVKCSCMMSSLGNLHILKVEYMYLWNKKRYLRIVDNIFLLIQTTSSCFKMALIGKM